MSENIIKLKTCTRCHSAILESFFGLHRKGGLCKTCMHCRRSKEEYRPREKEIKKHALDKNNYIVSCKCGDSYTLNRRSNHYQSKAHRDWLKSLKREINKKILEQHLIPDVADLILDF